MAATVYATGFKDGLGLSSSSFVAGEDYTALAGAVPTQVRVAHLVRPRPMMKNVNEGKGLFALIVVITRNVIGKKTFNQLRGKAIALHSQAPSSRNHSFIPRATTEEDSSSSSETPTDLDDNFEDRLSQVRLRYRSGTGKKAELRKTRKGKKIGSGSGSSIYLPPVPLKESISEGQNVEFGFSPFSERVNGRIAILGLSALFLVELATGKGVINYHSPPIVLIQVYFVAAISALYLKYEKEKISVWPEK